MADTILVFDLCIAADAQTFSFRDQTGQQPSFPNGYPAAIITASEITGELVWSNDDNVVLLRIPVSASLSANEVETIPVGPYGGLPNGATKVSYKASWTVLGEEYFASSSAICFVTNQFKASFMNKLGMLSCDSCEGAAAKALAEAKQLYSLAEVMASAGDIPKANCLLDNATRKIDMI